MPKLVKIKQSKSKQVASIDAQATTPPDTGNKPKHETTKKYRNNHRRIQE